MQSMQGVTSVNISRSMYFANFQSDSIYSLRFSEFDKGSKKN
jgi:hypothetical protein